MLVGTLFPSSFFVVFVILFLLRFLTRKKAEVSTRDDYSEREKKLHAQQIREVDVGLPQMLQVKQLGWDAGLGCAGVAWDSGVILSRILVYWDAAASEPQTMALIPETVRGAFPLAGKRILEVGCGTGVTSVTAGALGADVFATDLREVVALVQSNVDRNGKFFLPSPPASSPAPRSTRSPKRRPSLSVTVASSAHARPRVLPLTWGCKEESDEVIRQITRKAIDSPKEPLLHLIVGADVAYLPEHFDDLLKTLLYIKIGVGCKPSGRQPLSSLNTSSALASFASPPPRPPVSAPSSCTVLLAYRPRGDIPTRFFERAVDYGFSVDLLDIPQEIADDVPDVQVALLYFPRNAQVA